MKKLSLLLLALLCGCGPMLQARVLTFHELPPNLTTVTFAVVPFENQQGSLEFISYARQVVAKLEAKGLKSAPLEQADYLLFLSYSIDQGRAVAFSYPLFGQTGVASASTMGTIRATGNQATYSSQTNYTPTYGVVGTGAGVRTEFTRNVRLDLLRKTALESNKIKKIYEGEVVSSGSVADIPTVMPTLLKALLEDFPGDSGRPKVVKLPIK